MKVMLSTDGYLQVKIDDSVFKRLAYLKASTGKTFKTLIIEAIELLEKKYGNS